MTVSVGANPVPPLARGVFDRDYRSRSQQELLRELRLNPEARVLPLWRGKTLLDGTAVRLLHQEPDGEAPLTCYLGRTTSDVGSAAEGSPIRLVVLDDDAARALDVDEGNWRGLRDVAGLIDDESAALLAAAAALANWHLSSAHCPRCGGATEIEQSGWARRCVVCGNELFPRTDPAIIVVVTDDQDRLLLGSNILWEQGRYSLLAGFVEAGESLENAVVREIEEESGLKVANPIYRSSQPWPFPRSLMLGFHASVASDQDPDALQPDGDEIVDLRWFTRDELRHREGVLLPGVSSIARALIEEWLTADGGAGLDETEPDAPTTAADVRR
jgi:NAD+ diphosphatase